MKNINKNNLNLTSILLREGIMTISNMLIVGVFGLFWVFLNKESRSLFDVLAGTCIYQTKPSLAIISDFRQYREAK